MPSTLLDTPPATHATGPRTAAGKAASSRNATRHGLLSAATVLGKHESAAGWEEFCADIALSLAPSGRLEHALAERIAHLHWRLARLARYEAEAIDAVLLDPCATRRSGKPIFSACSRPTWTPAGSPPTSSPIWPTGSTPASTGKHSGPCRIPARSCRLLPPSS